jgi:hypothetical protein
MASNVTFTLYLGSGKDGFEKIETLKKIATKKGYTNGKGEPNVSKLINDYIEHGMKKDK